MLGAFWFSLASISVKLAGRNLPVMEVVLARALISIIICLYFIRRAGIALLGKNRKLLILRGLLGTGAMCCIFYALVHMPVTDAIVLFYTNPLWATVISFFVLKEKLGAKELLAVCLGFVGVIFIAKPAFLFQGVAPGHGWVALIALLSAFFAGLAYVTIRKIGSKENPNTIVFYLYLTTIPVAALLTSMDFVIPQGLDILWIILLGFFAQLAQINMTKGLSLISAGKATTIGNVQIIFVALWGGLFFHEIPDSFTWLGAFTIMSSTILLSQS